MSTTSDTGSGREAGGNFQVALNFEDGATRFIDCAAGELVLDAAYRNKVNLPMDCSDGVCGTCKCHCDQGQFELDDDYLDEALSEDEADQGYVLTCKMLVKSDCVISVPVPSTACKVTPSRQACTVEHVEMVSETTVALGLRLETPDALSFLPGQYVNLTIPGTDQHRAYSFSSAPGAEIATFLIRNIPGGLMSDWLTGTAKPGDEISLVGPYGSFFLRPVERPILLLAGGTGLAPILSMLEVMAESGTDQPVHLIYGVTKDEDLVETARIENLAAQLPTFTWMACVADPGSAHPHKGYVTSHITDKHLNGGDCDIYLCGPPPMVEAVREFLQAREVEPRQFHYEKFTPSEPA